MKKFVKFKGDKQLQGNYMTEGLTIDNYYEHIKTRNSNIFITVINDNGEKISYCTELFE